MDELYASGRDCKLGGKIEILNYKLRNWFSSDTFPKRFFISLTAGKSWQLTRSFTLRNWTYRCIERNAFDASRRWCYLQRNEIPSHLDQNLLNSQNFYLISPEGWEHWNYVEKWLKAMTDIWKMINSHKKSIVKLQTFKRLRISKWNVTSPTSREFELELSMTIHC